MRAVLGPESANRVNQYDRVPRGARRPPRFKRTGGRRRVHVIAICVKVCAGAVASTQSSDTLTGMEQCNGRVYRAGSLALCVIALLSACSPPSAIDDLAYSSGASAGPN